MLKTITDKIKLEMKSLYRQTILDVHYWLFESEGEIAH